MNEPTPISGRISVEGHRLLAVIGGAAYNCKSSCLSSPYGAEVSDAVAP
jgi:hypothetical protein